MMQRPERPERPEKIADESKPKRLLPDSIRNDQSDKVSIESESANVTIVDTIKAAINANAELHQYPVRDLVEQTKTFGKYLKEHELKTNHLRRFLDAVKQINARLRRGDKFSIVDNDIAFLKPRLAYAAARKKQEMKKEKKVNPAKDFSDVISAAIEKVKSSKDFDRLVQLIEATIAYHKEAGGE
jgi:CRISPR-associated protein Csm2